MRQSVVRMGDFLQAVMDNVRTGIMVEPIFVAHEMMMLSLTPLNREVYQTVARRADAGITLPEVAQETGLATNHAWNILNSLVDYGLVVQPKNNLYQSRISTFEKESEPCL